MSDIVETPQCDVSTYILPYGNFQRLATGGHDVDARWQVGDGSRAAYRGVVVAYARHAIDLYGLCLGPEIRFLWIHSP